MHKRTRSLLIKIEYTLFFQNVNNLVKRDLMSTPKGKQTKERICLAAIELINSCGYDNVTVADICKKAQVSNGSFFHHFKAKDDVLVEFVCQEGVELLNYYESLPKENAIQLFREIIAWQARYYQFKGEEFIAHLHAHLILSKHKLFVDYPLGAVLGKCIALGQEQGVMRKDIDAKRTGELFFDDILAVTSFVPWSYYGDKTIADVIVENAEQHLKFCLV